MELLGLNNNQVFITLFILACLIIIGFVVGAWIVNSKRGTAKQFGEVIWSMVKQPLFITAGLAGLITGVFTGNYEAMFLAVIAYMGYKLIATELIVLKNGDNKFTFFESGTLNTWASFIISTKSVVAVAGIFVLWLAGYRGLFDNSIVGERIMEIVATWAAANGIPIATALKGKDFSFLNPVKKVATTTGAEGTSDLIAVNQGGKIVYVKKSEIPELEYKEPTPEPEKWKPNLDTDQFGGRSIATVFPESPNKPPYTGFDAEEWESEKNKLSIANEGETDPVNDAQMMWRVAGSKICWYIQNILDLLIYNVNDKEDAYIAKFGFAPDKIGEHLADKKLVKCAVNSVNVLRSVISVDYGMVWDEYDQAQRLLVYFINQWDRLGDHAIELRLNTGRFTYADVMDTIGKWKTEAEIIEARMANSK